MTTWPARLTEVGPKRVLSIDGGGVRGALAIALLGRLETALRRRCGRPDLVLADYFDLIGGTSVGAIIAGGLALGQEMADVEKTFLQMAPQLFGSTGLPRIPLIQARFDPKVLARLIASYFGDATLGSAAWRTGFAAVAKRVDTGSSWLLTNSPKAKYWNAVGAAPAYTPNRDYVLSSVIHASAAAPFFFDLAPIEIAPGVTGVFFDGAITPYGNPSLLLAMAALIPAYGFGWTAGASSLLIVSVGAGAPRPRKPTWRSARRLAIWKALHGLISIAYDTSELAVTALQWLGSCPQPWRINSEIEALESGPPHGVAPLWTFLRYDAPLERDWLKQHLGVEMEARAEGALQRMDDHRLIPRLLEIGRLAGDRFIRPDHFPEAFAPPEGRSSP